MLVVGPNNQSYLIFTIFEMSLYCKLEITVMDGYVWAHRRRWLAGWPCDCLSLAHIDTGARKMADLKLVDLTKMGEMKLAKLKMADQKWRIARDMKLADLKMADQKTTVVWEDSGSTH